MADGSSSGASSPTASLRLLAWTYALTAAIGQSLRSPRWALRALRRAAALLRGGGWTALERQVLQHYLPARFRLRTRVRLGGPSTAVYRKFAGLVVPPDATSTLALPWGRLREPARILVIRSAAMGDVLMATPIVRKLHQDRGGHALIDMATRYPQVFAGNPYVHRTLDPARLADAPGAYDLVVDLDGVYERNPAVHVVDAYAFHACGSVAFDKRLELFASDADRACARDAADAIGRPYLVVHKPEHPWPNRNLPRAMWHALLQRLLQGCRHTIVQIGGPADLALTHDPRLLDHRNRYSMQALQLLIAGSAGYVGVDAGPLHVAATTDVPICAFFTSAHHELRKPLRPAGTFVPLVPGIDCYGCQAGNPLPGTHYLCQRGDNACVDRFDTDVAAARILAAIDG